MANWALKKYRELAKGFVGRGRNTPKSMMNRVQKSLQYAYISRKQRPRLFRREWIQTVNAAVREHHINYSRFIFGLNYSNLQLDRKILANMAVNEPYTFKAIVDEVKVQAQLREKPREPVSLAEAYERGYVASGITQTWYKRGVKEGYKLFGQRRPFTPKEKEQFEKGG